MNIDKKYYGQIQENLKNTLQDTKINAPNKKVGKVRDAYFLENQVLMVSTDRQSAFDRVLAAIPYKGAVLNLVSAWWFEQTKDMFPNHLISVPDPNVSLVEKCDVFPVEFVVRGYITGTTDTSLWTVYNGGAREYCGNSLPEGLKKNDRLGEPMLTPTTKDKVHDKPVSKEEIIDLGLMREDEFNVAAKMSLDLFRYGQKIAKENGLILVDTKYEIGRGEDGQIKLVDEIHTPDSSRYWMKNEYEIRFNQGQKQLMLDKENIRQWLINKGFSGEGTPPELDSEIRILLSEKYIELYNILTNKKFKPSMGDVNNRIKDNLNKYGFNV